MKKILSSIALFSVLGLFIIGCEKKIYARGPHYIYTSKTQSNRSFSPIIYKRTLPSPIIHKRTPSTLRIHKLTPYSTYSTSPIRRFYSPSCNRRSGIIFYKNKTIPHIIKPMTPYNHRSRMLSPRDSTSYPSFKHSSFNHRCPYRGIFRSPRRK